MEFAAALSAADSSTAVEAALNDIIATETEIPTSAQDAIKKALEQLCEDPVRVNNAKLRRRVKRLIVGMDEINARIADAVASAQASHKAPPATVITEALPPISIIDCASELSCATSHYAVESALNRLAMPDMTSPTPSVKEDLKQLQKSINDICASAMPLKKLVRRRLQRLLYVITGGAVKNIAATSMKALATTKPTTTKSSTPLKASNTTATPSVPLSTAKSVADALRQLNGAKTVDTIEAALSEVTQNSNGTNEERTELAAVIDAMLKSAEVTVPSKLKRKMQRLGATLLQHPPVTAPDAAAEEPLQQTKKNHIKATSAEPVEVTTVKSYLSPSEICSELSVCSSSAALDTLLGQIDPALVLTPEYNTVQEQLKQMLGNSIVNSKLRRRINRLMLAPTSGAAVDMPPVAVVAAPQTVESSAEATKHASGTAVADKTPCIIFLGQLNYHTTREEIEAHLHTHHITNIKNIRMLTDKKTGKFKGMAFVEFDDAFAMHQCLALHHSTLKGRRINVEKSCGGSNKDVRNEKIVQQKSHQFHKIKEAVDSLLAENNLSVTNEFLDKLYSFSPSVVKTMIENYKQVSNDISVFEKFIDDYHLNNKLVRTVAAVPKKRSAPEASPVKKKSKREQPSEQDKGNSLTPWNLLQENESRDSKKRGLSDIFPSVRGRGGKIGLGNRK